MASEGYTRLWAPNPGFRPDRQGPDSRDNGPDGVVAEFGRRTQKWKGLWGHRQDILLEAHISYINTSPRRHGSESNCMDRVRSVARILLSLDHVYLMNPYVSYTLNFH